MKVVFVTPNEVDSGLAAGFLDGASVETVVCEALAALDSLPLAEVGCAIFVEEALEESDLAQFREALDQQPPWSDLPILLLAARDSSLSALGENVFPRSGNVTLLQRPLHPMTLVSAVNMALRARVRQFEVRDLLRERERALQQRDEFLAMLAHELRNPLAPIRNAAYLLGTIDSPTPLFVKCRLMIEKQARHMTRLVDDLLDVSRLELGKVGLRMQSVDLNEIVAAAVEASMPFTSLHGHSVRLNPRAECVHVQADPMRLEQVVGNLIVNAAKFTPPGGTIEVETEIEGDEATVAVKDNGVGIRSESLDTIFDLFRQETVTSARVDGGLGIGLTLVRRLMELHGGSVSASSDGVGHGARFVVRLPTDPAWRECQAASAGAIPEGTPKRVLIVEDAADVRESLAMLLRQWKHVVIHAANGPDGVHRAREERPDVALIDIGLPGFDGYDVAREIRLEGSEWARSVRLIALTGYGQAADRARATDSGFDMHVLKPVDPAELKLLLAS